MQSTIVFDSRAGLFFSDEYFYAGFSVDNLLATHMDGHKDKTLITPTPRPHYYLTAGALFPVSNSLAFRPSFLLKDDRGGPTSLDMNVFALLNDRDRTSDVKGKSVYVRVDIGGRRIITKKNKESTK